MSKAHDAADGVALTDAPTLRSPRRDNRGERTWNARTS